MHEFHSDERAVSLWVNRWTETHSLQDAERSGHPRCTTDDTDQTIESFADERVRVSPRDIARELNLLPLRVQCVDGWMKSVFSVEYSRKSVPRPVRTSVDESHSLKAAVDGRRTTGVVSCSTMRRASTSGILVVNMCRVLSGQRWIQGGHKRPSD